MPSADASRGMHSSGHELTLFFDDFEVCTAFLVFAVPFLVPRFNCDSTDRCLFCLCATRQPSSPVRTRTSLSCAGPLTVFVTLLPQRWQIQLYGRSYADHLVSCHRSGLCVSCC